MEKEMTNVNIFEEDAGALQVKNEVIGMRMMIIIAFVEYGRSLVN